MWDWYHWTYCRKSSQIKWLRKSILKIKKKKWIWTLYENIKNIFRYTNNIRIYHYSHKVKNLDMEQNSNIFNKTLRDDLFQVTWYIWKPSIRQIPIILSNKKSAINNNQPTINKQKTTYKFNDWINKKVRWSHTDGKKVVIKGWKNIIVWDEW